MIFLSKGAFAQAVDVIVPVGGTGAVAAFYDDCTDNNGNFLDTAYSFSAVTPLPSGVASVTFSPNPTNEGWNKRSGDEGWMVVPFMSVTASPQAAPGLVTGTYAATPQGNCPNYNGFQPQIDVTVVPGVTGPTANPDFVWWFGEDNDGNHLDPNESSFPIKATLTLPAPITSANGPS